MIVTGTVVSAIGVAAALAVMAILIFKGISAMIAGPVAVIIVCLTSGINILDALTDTYLNGVAGFFVSYFLIFLLGNILGNIYELSGAAAKIGRIIAGVFGAKKEFNCMVACLVCAAVMSYGGINSFVIIFTIYPIALHLFEEADIPTHLMPGILCGGMWTFAMTGPFTPQIPNILAMQNLGVSSYAGLIPGLAACAAMAILIVLFMTRAARKCKAKGMHFEKKTEIAQTNALEESDRKYPPAVSAFLPLVVVIAGFNLTKLGIIVWLAIGIGLALLLQFPYMGGKELLKQLNKAATSAALVNLNTAAIVGFGSVTGLTPFYSAMVAGLSGFAVNPYVTAVVSSNLCSAILGSASGGMALMFTSLKTTFLNFAASGANIDYIARLCALGGGCLDTMPWNGSIISIFSVCKTTHKKSYIYNFVTCGVIPLICTLAIALPICMITG